jgi:asparagine synthase (glutamine-hydrolysing)
MCGIYGWVAGDGRLGEPSRVAPVLEAMDRALVHRGPDDSGSYFDGACAMGMRRLSIIDLAGGRQPIANEDRTLWVVFNGEIYNHAELHEQLTRRGHSFATASDTEVLVHLFEERRSGLLDALDGMFAFALWDRSERALLLARDRLGIKPLYYACVGAHLVFASELKALLRHPRLERVVSPEALSHYLSFGTTPPDQAILAGVRKLQPGHLLTFRRGELTVRRWWDLDLHARPVAPEQAAEEVRAHIRRAVRAHLVSDVPVGAFLSGGIDSATVVGTMCELGAVPKTFSIGFREPAFDELRWARLVARHFGTDHHELVVAPDAWDLVEGITWHLDEPFADVSALPTYLVAQLAARHVKVVLTGDGGDEVFAGYDRYPLELAEARRYDPLPARARRAIDRLAAALPDAAPGKHYLRHAALDPRRRFIDGQALFPADLKARLLGPSLRERLAGACDPENARVRLFAGAPGDALARLLYLDTMTYLPLDILTKVDRMTMACSLEARPPLLDHHLVEAVARLPSAFKIAPGPDGQPVQKALLKRAVADLLPATITERGKQGFGVPIARWLRGPLRDPLHDLVLSRRAGERGLLDRRFVRALVREHEAGRRDQSLRLWGLLVLELWLRRYLDTPAAAEADSRAVAHA